MKVALSFTVCVTITACTLFAQEAEELKDKIEKLRANATSLETDLLAVRNMLAEAEQQLGRMELESFVKRGEAVVVRTTGQAWAFDGPSVAAHNIFQIPKGTEVTVLSASNKPFFEIVYEGQRAFLLGDWLDRSDPAKAAAFDAMRTIQDQTEREQREANRAAKERQLQEQQARQVDKERQRQKAREAEENAKRARLSQKYSKEIVELIMSGKVRIGMTSDQAVEAWGKPEDINRTITRHATTEQWVYDIGRYLYFENGTLVSIQQ